MTYEQWQSEDEAYHAKIAAKLAEIDARYARKLAAWEAYYAREFARVERLYGCNAISEEEAAAQRYALLEDARFDREAWGGVD